jgi:hypothetical protein
MSAPPHFSDVDLLTLLWVCAEIVERLGRFGFSLRGGLYLPK